MVLSKGLSFGLFLYIAKQLSELQYGNYIYIAMVLSLLPLFQFGSRHGATVLLPKAIAKKDDSDTSVFTNYNNVSLLIQFFSGCLLVAIDLDVGIRTIAIIALTFWVMKYVENAQLLLNSNLKLESSNFIKAVDQILRPVITFAFFSYFNTLESIFWGQFVSVCFAFIVSLVYLPLNLSFCLNKKLLKQLYRVGFFIYLIWATDLVFRTADRWFISQFYSKSELASYGFASSFANNIWLLCLALIAPYAQLLYKQVAEGDFESVKKLVENTNKKIYILVGITSLAVAITYPFITTYILDKYTETYFLALVLVLVSVFLSINNMYIYYMNINNLHFTLLKCQSIVLVVNLTLNAYIAFRHLDTIYFGLSTAVSLILYFILVQYSYERNLKLKLDQGSRGSGV